MAFELHKIKGGHNQLIGYARVSTRDQSLASQLVQLKQAGCCRVYAEKCSSVGPREGWQALIQTLRTGDTVVVVRLDRIGRKLVEVVQCVADIVESGSHVKSLMQSIDTRSPGGKYIIPIWAALAETEREILRERVRAGVEAARAQGKRGGRPRLRTPAKEALIRHLRAQGHSLRKIAAEVGVSEATVRRACDEPPDRGDPRQLKLLDATPAAPPATEAT